MKYVKFLWHEFLYVLAEIALHLFALVAYLRLSKTVVCEMSQDDTGSLWFVKYRDYHTSADADPNIPMRIIVGSKDSPDWAMYQCKRCNKPFYLPLKRMKS